MILNGPKLLLRPKTAWNSILEEYYYSFLTILAGAITAALLPTIIMVAGHLISAKFEFTSVETAIQRAAIGFVVIALGAFVMIPSLTLAIIKIGTASRAPVTADNASQAAMGLVWATWTSGIVLGLPPALNLSPEYGEFLWAVIASLTAYYIITRTIVPGLPVHRRWRSKFIKELLITYVILFISVPVIPSLIMRFLVGVTGTVAYGAPPEMEWPIPPSPNW